MKKLQYGIWMMPSFIISLGALGIFTQPWIQFKTSALTFSLFLLVIGYIGYLVFAKTLYVRFHFLHTLIILGCGVVVLSVILSPNLQNSLFGPLVVQSDNSILLIFSLLAILILPQLAPQKYTNLYRGVEIAVTLGALYTIILQVIPFGSETMTKFWNIFGFEVFPRVLIASDIATALIIHALIGVGLFGQALFATIRPNPQPLQLTYYIGGFLINFLLTLMFIGESAPIYAYLIQIIGFSLMVIFFARKVDSRNTFKITFITYVFIAVSVVATSVSPTMQVLRARTAYLTSYAIPVTLQSLQARPILGYGAGSIATAWNRHYPVAYNYTPAWEEQQFTLSSEVLDVIVQFGVVGGVLILIFSVGIVFFGAITILKNFQCSDIYYVALTGLMLLGLTSIQVSWNPVFVLLAILWMSILIGEHFRLRIFITKKIALNNVDISPTVASTISFSSMVVFVLISLYSFRYLQVLRSDYNLQQALQAQSPQETLVKSARAMELYPSNIQAAQVYVPLELQEVNKLLLEELRKEEPNMQNIQNRLDALMLTINIQINRHPNDYAGYSMKASIYTTFQQYMSIQPEEFEEVLQSLREQAPNDPRVDVYKAQYFLTLHQASVASAQEGQTTQEENTSNYLEQAQTSLNEAIQKKNDLASAYFVYASIYQLLEQPEEAITKIEEYRINVIQNTQNRGPLDLNVMTLLAQNYINVKRFTEAEELTEQLLATSPNSEVIYVLRGQIDEEKGLDSQALEWYQKALELAPENETIIQKVNTLKEKSS